MDVIAKFGEVETALAEAKIDRMDEETDMDDRINKYRARSTAESTRFASQIMNDYSGQQMVGRI